MGKPCHHALSGLLGCHICHPMPVAPVEAAVAGSALSEAEKVKLLAGGIPCQESPACPEMATHFDENESPYCDEHRYVDIVDQVQTLTTELAAARRENEEAHVGFLSLLHAVHLLVDKRAPYEVLDAVVNVNAIGLVEKVKATVVALAALTTERDALRAALRSVRAHLASGPFKKHRFDCPAAHAPMCAGIGGGDGRDYTCKCGFAEVDYVMKFVVSEAALAPKKEAL